MNSRERTLAIAVGALALIMAVYFIWSSVDSALAQRHATLNTLRSDADKQNRLIREAARATRRLEELKERSLPEDRERAQAVYQTWLLGLVDRHKFFDPSVKQLDSRLVAGGFFHQSRFEVNAQATLDQVTGFLAEFYSAGDLHRIQQLNVTPRGDSRRVDFHVVIEALSLPGTKRTTAGDIPSPQLASLDIAALEEAVLNRNMFFPANQPPKIESIGTQRVPRGTPLRVTVKASDADKWDKLSFSLTGEPPEGVKIEPKGDGEAVVTWSPPEKGDYEIQLLVQDDGLPRRTEKATLKVSVVDPPPPRVADDGRRVIGFDDATQTFLVATVAIDEQPEAWFSVRTTGQLLRLTPGAQLDVGSIRAELSAINDKQVELTTSDGVVRVRVGQSLSEAMSLTAGTGGLSTRVR